MACNIRFVLVSATRRKEVGVLIVLLVSDYMFVSCNFVGSMDLLGL